MQQGYADSSFRVRRIEESPGRVGARLYFTSMDQEHLLQ